MEGEGCGLFCSEVPLFESNVSTILSLMTSIYDYTGLKKVLFISPCQVDFPAWTSNLLLIGFIQFAANILYLALCVCIFMLSLANWEWRSKGLWESLSCPMKIINKICFSAHLNYRKCKNNYLFFPDENILPSLQNLRCDADQVRNKTILPSNLRTVAAKKGFLVSDNQASGNCLFYALSEQLKSVKGIQISHKELRNTLVQFLRENANLVRQWWWWCNCLTSSSWEKKGKGL